MNTPSIATGLFRSAEQLGCVQCGIAPALHEIAMAHAFVKSAACIVVGGDGNSRPILRPRCVSCRGINHSLAGDLCNSCALKAVSQ